MKFNVRRSIEEKIEAEDQANSRKRLQKNDAKRTFHQLFDLICDPFLRVHLLLSGSLSLMWERNTGLAKFGGFKPPTLETLGLGSQTSRLDHTSELAKSFQPIIHLCPKLIDNNTINIMTTEELRLDTLWPDALVNISLFLPMDAILYLSQSCRRIRSCVTNSADIWKEAFRRRWPLTSHSRLDQVEGWRGYCLRRHLFEEILLAVPNPPGPKLIKGVHFEVKNLGEHIANVHSLDCRGAWVASGSADKTVRLWDRTGKRQPMRFESHGDAVKSVRFCRYEPATLLAPSPMLTASNDKTVKFWRYESRNCKYEDVLNLRGHTEKVSSVDFRSSTLAVSGGWDKLLISWDLSTGKISRKIPNAGVTSFVSAHQHTVVTSTRDKLVRLWDLRVKENLPSASFKGHSAAVTCHHADNLWIVSGGEDSSLRWWDIRRPNEYAVSQLKSNIGSITFDDSVLLAGDWSGSVTLLSMQQPGKIVTSIKEHNGAIEAILLNRMNLFTSGTDKVVKSWEFKQISLSNMLQ